MTRSSLHVFLILLILSLTGCNLPNSTLNPPQLQVNPSLPKVTDIKTISDIESVAFEWKKTEDSKVSGYYLFRSDPEGKEQTLSKVRHKISDRYTTHFVDDGLKPNTIYFYQMATYNEAGQISDRSPIVEVKTRELNPISFIQAISNYPRRVKVLWRPHPNDRIKGYVIERSDGASKEWNQVHEIKSRLLAEFIDKDLKDSFIYRYRIMAVTFDGLLSPPSQIAEAKTKPVPKEVKGIVTTLDLPKRIELSWLPNMEKDISHYNLYHADTPKSVFTKLSEVNGTRFSDPIMEDGKERFYKLTAVDEDGLEGLMPGEDRAVRGMTLPIPDKPQLTSATIQDKKAIIRWKKTDPRAKTYIVTKTLSGWLDGKSVTFNNITAEQFVDQDILPGTRYKYSVSAVDKHGLVSEMTEEVELYLPSSMKEE